MIIAIDPGKNKCGLAVMEKSGEVLDKSVIERRQLSAQIRRLFFGNKVEKIVIGKSAFGRQVAKDLEQHGLVDGIVFVSEEDSSRQAREKYWRENPPAGLWRFIPTSLRFPPRPIDDYTAVIIGQRYYSSTVIPDCSSSARMAGF